MTLREVVKLLNGTVYLGENRLDEEVEKGFASDLMSDVLTLKEAPMLITGLCNVQTIRTCDMATLDIVVFVRNKKPTPDMVELAEDNDMVLIATSYSMFRAVGMLYQAGIKPLY
jgi:predicted transcriptional regulator